MINRIHVFLLFAFATSVASAQITETRLIASDGSFSDFLGGSVSASGDRALAGAYGDDENGQDAGAAYVFQHNGSNWVQQAKLLASDGTAFAGFGSSVSLSGDYAIVGSSDDDNGSNAGAAYVFHFNGSTWVQQAKLLASDGADNDYFGYSVAIAADYALVGALYGNNVNGNSAGAAYMFHRVGSTWTEQAKLIAGNGEEFEVFGSSVALSGDYALIGSPYDDDNGAFAGSAYIFHYNGTNWVEQDKVLASDGTFGNYFGWSVSVSGDYALVGALNEGGNGSAYVYHRNGSSWEQQDKLVASDGQIYDWFATSVSLSGDYALLGTYGDDDNGDDAGSAYIFHRNGSDWEEHTKLMASDGRPYDQFGIAASLSEDHALVGAFWDDQGNRENAGSAYVFSGFASSTPAIPCDVIGFFNARCSANGAAQAVIRIPGSTEYVGEIVEFQLDDTIYPVELIVRGTSTIGKLHVARAGSGPHTISLADPAGCFDPLVIECQVDAAITDPELDALWEEYDDVLADQSLVQEIPQETQLIGNYPNPFNPETTFEFSLRSSLIANLSVYNLLGEKVATVVDGQLGAGTHRVQWNATGHPSGLYIYRLQAGGFTETRKLVLLR